MARSELVLTLPMPIFVDDCGLIGSDDVQVNAEMLAFHEFCDVVCGVFFKFLKDRAAAQRQLMIGFWWDSRTLTRTLDEVKLLSCMMTLADYATRPTLTLQEMPCKGRLEQRPEEIVLGYKGSDANTSRGGTPLRSASSRTRRLLSPPRRSSSS